MMHNLLKRSTMTVALLFIAVVLVTGFLLSASTPPPPVRQVTVVSVDSYFPGRAHKFVREAITEKYSQGWHLVGTVATADNTGHAYATLVFER